MDKQRTEHPGMATTEEMMKWIKSSLEIHHVGTNTNGEWDTSNNLFI